MSQPEDWNFARRVSAQWREGDGHPRGEGDSSWRGRISFRSNLGSAAGPGGDSRPAVLAWLFQASQKFQQIGCLLACQIPQHELGHERFLLWSGAIDFGGGKNSFLAVGFFRTISASVRQTSSPLITSPPVVSTR